MKVGEVVNAWMHDGSLSSLRKFGSLLCQAAHEPKRVVPAWMLCRRRRVRIQKNPKRCLEGVGRAQRLCDSVGMLVARSWTHRSQLPIVVLWGTAASQVHIKTGDMDKVVGLEELPSALPGCPAQVDVCHNSVSI